MPDSGARAEAGCRSRAGATDSGTEHASGDEHEGDGRCAGHISADAVDLHGVVNAVSDAHDGE